VAIRPILSDQVTYGEGDAFTMLEWETLANQYTIAKFANVFPCQHFALYNTNYLHAIGIFTFMGKT